MNFKDLLFTMCLLLLMSGCGPNKQLAQVATSSSKQMYQLIAHKKYGENAECFLNPNLSYVLCQKRNPDTQLIPNQLIEFFVYDIQKQKIIYEDKIANAEITWHNNTQLLITNQRGYITGPTDTGKWTYLFDLLTKKKITPGKTQ
ncbi:hypothetical protein EO244_11635 [Ancylomarina salipaludis]|uniref:Lipoprotein n=1 Tax=Ancylomarina salipaludis TaxID=2501299 RepID=A0A4Q1JJW2_9BACT|nr:hypothetical protein [Ancylomarina salipaludis]RXQ92194.1 hypothetical protein EO244_11635 [Ancylomarina salipaludis]